MAIKKSQKKIARPIAKKKVAKKQVVKQVVKKVKMGRPAPMKQQGVMAIVPYSEIATPEMHKGKYTLAPTMFSDMQIKAIIAPTPRHIIKSRPGKGGGNWDYVPGWWFKKKANFVFGFAHDFEIEGERVDGDFVTVKGKVTVRDPKTGKITAIKSDYGGAAIKFKSKMPHTPANYLDISNDFKAAATDCFKRCMVQFGFAMDVYGKSESIEAGQPVREDRGDEQEYVTEQPRNVRQTNEVTYIKTAEASPSEMIEKFCTECGNPMTKAEADYSNKMFKRQLCRTCQAIRNQLK